MVQHLRQQDRWPAQVPMAVSAWFVASWLLFGTPWAGSQQVSAPGVTAAPAAASAPVPISAASTEAQSTTVRPLRRAHSHNDYEHDRPLLDALDHGFTSVEADIYLVDNELLVAHDRPDVRPDRTLASLYLQPLQALAKQHGGQIWPNTQGEFILWIDLKSEAATTFPRLQQELLKYRELFVRTERGAYQPGPVLVVISGNRDLELMSQAEPRLATIDGRLPHLDQPVLPPAVMRFVSDNWTQHFSWRGQGEFPDEERRKLQRLVQRAHDQERRIRFWATPENEAVWRELLDAKVDLLNTDQLERLQQFLQQHDAP